MADDSIKTKKVTDLGENTSLTDEDLFIIGSSGSAALRRVKWKNILTDIGNTIKAKLSEWTFPTLDNKTIPGMVNELNTKITAFSDHYAGQNEYYATYGRCEQLKDRYLLNFRIGSGATANYENANFLIGKLDIHPYTETRTNVLLQKENKVIGYGLLTVATNGDMYLKANISATYIIFDAILVLYTGQLD